MANRFCNLTGTNKIKDEYDLLNSGFDDIEAEIDAIDSRVDQHVAGNAERHSAADLDNDTNVSGTDLQDVINSMDTRMDNHVSGSTERHSASEIDNDSFVTGTNVDNALETLKGLIDAITTADSNAAIGLYDMVATGSDTITGSYSGLTYFGGLKVLLVTDGTNETEAVTVNFESQGVKSVKFKNEAGVKRNLYVNEMPPLAMLYYDGTDFILMNGQTADYSAIESTFAEIYGALTKCAGGKLDLTVKGLSLVNDVSNYDFSNGTTGWYTNFSSIATSNNIATSTGDGTGSSPYFNNSTSSFGVKNGDKLFVYIKVRVTNSNCTSLLFYHVATGDTDNYKTIASPTQNQWYEGYGITTLSVDDTTTWVQATHVYADAATANGKVMEIDGNAGVFTINMTALGIESYTEAQMLDIVRGSGFEGLEGMHPHRVKSVVKNLIPTYSWEQGSIDASGTEISDTQRIRTGFIKVSNSTQYAIRSGIYAGYSVSEYSEQGDFITQSVSGLYTANTTNTFTTQSNTKYIRIAIRKEPIGTLAPSEYEDLMLQLEQGSTATTYEPYTETSAFTKDVLHSLPNGTRDEFDFGSGKDTKNCEEYELVAGDITLGSPLTNVDRVYISFPIGFNIPSSTDNEGKRLITEISNPLNNGTVDSTVSHWLHYITTSFIVLIVPSGTYATTGDAQTALTGTKIIYELETPVITYYPPQVLPAFKSGTIYKEPILPLVGWYNGGFPVDDTNYPIDSIDVAYKINIETGAFERISVDDVTVASDGLSIESITGGTSEEYYYLEYKYTTQHTAGELDIEYAKNTVAVVEDNTDMINTLSERVDANSKLLLDVEGLLPDVAGLINTFNSIAFLGNQVAGGQAEVEVKGQSLVNNTTNYDFSNGTTDFSASQATLSVTDKIMSVTGNGAGGAPGVYQNNSYAKTGDVIFSYSKFKLDNSDCVYVRLTAVGSSTEIIDQVDGPTTNTWYEAYGIRTLTADAPGYRLYHIYATAGIANGSVMEVDGNAGVFTINMTALGIEDYTEAQMLDIVRGSGFEELDSAHPMRLKSVSKNLWNGNANNYTDYNTGAFTLSEADGTITLTCTASVGTFRGVTWTFNLKPSTIYRFKDITTTTGTQAGVRISDGETGVAIYDSSTTNNFDENFTTPSHGKITIKLYVTGSGSGTFTVTHKPQLEQNSVATTYEPYTETSAFTHETLHSVPNGTKDEDYVTEGKVVRRCREYIIKASDITAVSNITNVQRVIVEPSWDDYKVFTEQIDSQTIFDSYTETQNNPATSGDGYDQTSKHYHYATRSSPAGTMALIMPESTYADLAEAQADLAGTKIIYQLATPVTTYYPPQVLPAYPSGTIYKEPILPTIAMDNAGFTTDYPDYLVEEIDFIEKVNVETGDFERISNDDVITDGVQKLLASGDITGIDNSSYTNVETITVAIAGFTDLVTITTDSSTNEGITLFDGFPEKPFADSIDNIGSHFVSTVGGGVIGLVVAKNTYTTLAEAQDGIRNLRSLYKSTNKTNVLGVIGSTAGDWYYLEYKYSNEHTVGELDIEYAKNMPAVIKDNSEMVKTLSDRVDDLANTERTRKVTVNYTVVDTASFSGYTIFIAPEACVVTKITMMKQGSFTGVDAANPFTVAITDNAINTVATTRLVANAASTEELSLDGNYNTLASGDKLDLAHTFGGTATPSRVTYQIEYIIK